MKMIDAADPQRTGTVDFFGFFGIQVYMVLKLKTSGGFLLSEAILTTVWPGKKIVL